MALNGKVNSSKELKEDKELHLTLGEIAEAAGTEAVEQLKEQAISITQLEGNDIVEINSKGEKTVLKTLNISRRKVQPGTKTSLSNE